VAVLWLLSGNHCELTRDAVFDWSSAISEEQLNQPTDIYLLKSEIGERKRAGGVLYLHVCSDVIRGTLLQREIGSTGFLTNTE
jgi:hypothetical protein